jgi:hypothetical protein
MSKWVKLKELELKVIRIKWIKYLISWSKYWEQYKKEYTKENKNIEKNI